MVAVQLSTIQVGDLLNQLKTEENSPKKQENPIVVVSKNCLTTLKNAINSITDNKLSEDPIKRREILTFHEANNDKIQNFIKASREKITEIYKLIFKDLLKISNETETVMGEKPFGCTGFGTINRIAQIQDTLPRIDKILPKFEEEKINNANFITALKENIRIFNYISKMEETLSKAVSLKEQASTAVTSFKKLYSQQVVESKVSVIKAETISTFNENAQRTLNFLNGALRAIGSELQSFKDQKESILNEVNANINSYQKKIKNALETTTNPPTSQDIRNLTVNLILKIKIEKLIAQIEYRKSGKIDGKKTGFSEIEDTIEKFRLNNNLEAVEYKEDSAYQEIIHANPFLSQQKNVVRVKEKIEFTESLLQEYQNEIKTYFSEFRNINRDFYAKHEKDIEAAKLPALVYFQKLQEDFNHNVKDINEKNATEKKLLKSNIASTCLKITDQLKEVEKMENKISKIEARFAEIKNLGSDGYIEQAGKVVNAALETFTGTVSSATGIVSAAAGVLNPFSYWPKSEESSTENKEVSATKEVVNS